MAITRAQQAKQLLNEIAPKGERLAYINSREAKLLKKMGGAGIDVNGTGIKSYVDFGGGGSGYGSAQDTFDSAAGNSRSGGSRSDYGGGTDDAYQQSVRTNTAIANQRAAAAAAQAEEIRQEKIREEQRIITEAVKEGKKTTLQKVAPKTFKKGAAATRRIPVDAYIERDKKSQERFNRENNRMLLNTVKYGGNAIIPGAGTVASFAIGRDLDKKAAIEAQISNARIGGNFYTGPINAGSYNTKTGLYDAPPTRNPDVTPDGDSDLIPRPFMIQPNIQQEVIEEEPTPYDFDLYAARDNRVARRFAQGGRTGFNMGGMEEENLQAGAPDLRLEGSQIPQQEEMASAPGIDAELYQLFLDALRKGDVPQGTTFDAYKQLMMEAMSQQQGGQMQEQEMMQSEMMQPQMQEGIMQAQMMEPEREMAAYGGIMGSDGRRAYGFGSFFKKAARAVKKVFKSPIAKAALIAAGGYYAGGGNLFGLQRAAGKKMIDGAARGFKLGDINPMKFFQNKDSVAQKIKNYAAKEGITYDQAAKIVGTGGGAGSGLGQTLATIGIPLAMAGVYKQGKADERPMDENTLARIGQYNDPLFEDGIAGARARIQAGDNRGFNFMGPDNIYRQTSAQGGRIGANEGGLMNLGGNEMDLRGGGFVPLGAKEKADDVPARLSKNEFVFTADAVRAAGGGSVDKGAEKMYNTMKRLEGVMA